MGIIGFALLALLTVLVVLSGKEAVPLLIFVLRPGAMQCSFDDSLVSKGLLVGNHLALERGLRMKTANEPAVTIWVLSL